MILEYAQLLSTAHRVLDGKLVNKKYIFNDVRENLYYKATHVNHPSSLWVRRSAANYIWLYNLFETLCNEYSFRYGKIHKTEIERKEFLLRIPSNIKWGMFDVPTPAMPEKYIVQGDMIQSYRNYYNGEKKHLFSWKNRPTPNWIIL